MIPKIIHQTWKTLNIPDEWKDAVESCKNQHKDYKHIIWSHEMMESFVKKEYPDFYNVYMAYPYDIQRCDAFRYLVLYKYGGIYLDMDVICKKKIDSILEYDLVLTKSLNVENSYTNSFYMVIPNHPFIKFCIDNLPDYVNSYKYFGKHWHVMNSTGPNFLTNMIKKYGEKNIKNLYILNNKEYAGDCTVCNESTCKGGIYFSHTIGQSWNSWDSLFYNFLLCNYKKIIVGLLLLVAAYYIFFKRNKLLKSIKYKTYFNK
jgi:mannosyltransferase OCH1-like enzyme